jgi:hypothetical protein
VPFKYPQVEHFLFLFPFTVVQSWQFHPSALVAGEGIVLGFIAIERAIEASLARLGGGLIAEINLKETKGT